MPQVQNPFTTLYVTERMEDSQFPALFSPVLVPQIVSMFQTGNVVIVGTQGTGKSMLLALLRNDIRFAFEQDQRHPYPVDQEYCKFVSAGINLATNQALRFAVRWGRVPEGSNSLAELQGSFIDYLNTWILRDLLSSLVQLRSKPNLIWNKYDLGSIDSHALDAAVCAFGDDGGIGGLLNSPRDTAAAIRQLSQRIDVYLQFLNGKLRELPSTIRDTQSRSIGQPLSAAVNLLRSTGLLSTSTRVMVSIDQFEQLLDFESQLGERHFNLLREVVDEAIHLREPTICYRVGTRPYAWQTHRSERLRDYAVLDLDDLLSRTENVRSAVYSAFAEDVFRRRLKSFGYTGISDAKDPMKVVFGASPTPEARVARLSSNVRWAKVLKFPPTFPAVVRRSLEELSATEPVSAALGSAWTMQQLKAAKLGRTTVGELPAKGIEPWNEPEKRWWKKERVGIAVLQMAAACGQRVPMYGKRDVIALSGSNILVFGSICQHIWTAWIRSLNPTASERADPRQIRSELQDDGIRRASAEWHQKISEEPWLGDQLASFIDCLGNFLHRSLIADREMSYPGGNGFTLPDKEVAAHPKIERVLTEASGRGFLTQRRHTPKSRSRGPSTKWYLHPVLSPYFEITIAHTKEPLYLRAVQVLAWTGINGGDSRTSDDHSQRTLPGMEGL